jgi:hypothetical protein
MITYFIWGLLVTFIFDVILKNTENALNNKERFGFIVLWPVFLGWFFYYMIKNFTNND